MNWRRNTARHGKIWEQENRNWPTSSLRQQRRYKTGLFRFLLRSRLLVILSAPVIYAGWIPFLLIDLFVTTYQAICFPIYRIPKVKRSDYLVRPCRSALPERHRKIQLFLLFIRQWRAAYFREVAARTEQYWCPIKHARRVRSAHDRYPKFSITATLRPSSKASPALRKQYDDVAENRRRRVSSPPSPFGGCRREIPCVQPLRPNSPRTASWRSAGRTTSLALSFSPMRSSAAMYFRPAWWTSGRSGRRWRR